MAENELGTVGGPDRMPMFEDFDLPFIRAVGMFIPKRSIIIANLWEIHLNPADFPGPHPFDPERFFSPVPNSD
ncbi:hypothetical protein K438DRAFT_1984766 [Mycena galopus ATCC 62051]|nr:hypothetical protein K438DRAFT_1984766 [Mycena galopus ATCC 62051]